MTNKVPREKGQRRPLLAALLALLLLPAASGFAQHGGGGGGMGGPGGGGGMQRGGPPFGQGSGPFGGSTGNLPMPGGINPGSRRDPPGPTGGTANSSSTMRGGLQLGPPGRFWDDKGFARNLGLRKDQQKRMDAIFDANRSALVENYRTLQVEEKRLERITQERPLDETRIFAGIDAVVQARGVLEKALAHMSLQIRREMDADQVVRMDKYREQPPSEVQ